MEPTPEQQTLVNDLIFGVKTTEDPTIQLLAKKANAVAGERIEAQNNITSLRNQLKQESDRLVGCSRTVSEYASDILQVLVDTSPVITEAAPPQPAPAPKAAKPTPNRKTRRASKATRRKTSK